jgi:plasmid stabilization system protein ParE
MKILWSERAQNQVREIFEFVAEDRPFLREGVGFS